MKSPGSASFSFKKVNLFSPRNQGAQELWRIKIGLPWQGHWTLLGCWPEKVSPSHWWMTEVEGEKARPSNLKCLSAALHHFIVPAVLCSLSSPKGCQCRRPKRRRFNPWVRKIPYRRHGNPCYYSFLENTMDKGGWWATVHRVTKSWTWLKRLHTHSITQRIASCVWMLTT